ncbi:MAG: redoxin family protein, partial [Dehalococcoidia bacterium]
ASAPSSSATTSTAAPSTGARGTPSGPELVGTAGWINSEPLTIAGELSKNRAVLIDFWTYTCVNCIRTLPFVERWHERYGDHGLTVIGVHTPEFEFEHEHTNVEAAVRRYGLRYPVVQDNRYDTWDAFDNRFWPAKYLLVPARGVVFSHFGEGKYQDTELALRAELERLGYNLDGVPFTETAEPAIDAALTSQQTAELYGGYRHNYAGRGGAAGQDEYYLGPDQSQTYVDKGERASNRWYLQGEWLNEPEAISHNRRTTAFEDYIALRFRAMSANVVLHPTGTQPLDVVVELDGRPLLPTEAGQDVTPRADGRSHMEVRDARLYEVVRLPAFGEHELRLRSNSTDFAVYAFTFGSYEQGP